MGHLLCLLLLVSWLGLALGQAGVPSLGSEYNDVNPDGSYRFGFQTGDAGAHYQAAVANQKNQVAGRFGSWDPAQRRIVNTEYTAGRRGFRARGPNIARRMDLSQNKIPYNPPVNPESPNYNPTYDGYHDPNEDPSYSFNFNTPLYKRREASDSRGHVIGGYEYVDDAGDKHEVNYEAGSKIGFNVKTPFPDSKVFNGLFYRGSSKPGGKPRGTTSISQKLDGSYSFISSGPDQRRMEVSDGARNVKGSYTYVDDKGQQRTVEYIAGPNIGYRIVRKGARFPANAPFVPPPNFPRPGTTNPNFPSKGGPSGGRPFGGGDTNSDSEDNNYDSGSGGDNNNEFDLPPFPDSGSGDSFGGDSNTGGGGNFQDITPVNVRPPPRRPTKRPPGNKPTGGPSTGRPSTSWQGSGGPTERPAPPGKDGDSSANSDEYGGGDNNRYPRPHGESDENNGNSNGIIDGFNESGGSDENLGGDNGSKRPGSDSNESGFSEEFPNWPTSTTKPPLFKPTIPEGKYPQFPQSSRPITTTTIITSPTTESSYPGYFDGKPKPGLPPFPYPNNCCGSPTTTTRPDVPASAFPEDDPNRPHRPPPHGSTDDFLITPFDKLPPKNYDGFYKPPQGPSSRPNYYYPSQGDSTFLSSNKNYFSFPTGVAVRAHIQSLDILPFGSRIPPPGLALEQGISNTSQG